MSVTSPNVRFEIVGDAMSVGSGVVQLRSWVLQVHAFRPDTGDAQSASNNGLTVDGPRRERNGECDQRSEFEKRCKRGDDEPIGEAGI